MAVNLSPYGGVGAQFLDNAGNVLTGGKIETYAAGTTTPQAVYTDATGVTFHPNPIILDASGRVPSGGEIWLTDGLLYKFVLRDSNNVLIATYDNIAGINSNFVNFTNQQEIQTATAGQTVFTLTTTSYQPGTNSLSVFVDGVNQYGPGASYAYLETNSTTVTFTTGLHVGAEVKFTTSQSNSSGGTNASLVVYSPGPDSLFGPTTITVKDALDQLSDDETGADLIGITTPSGAFTNLGELASSGDDKGADMVGFIQSGTGAVAKTSQDKLREFVSVQDFGVVGDGIVDDVFPVANAITAANAANIPLVLSQSKNLYFTTTTIPTDVSIGNLADLAQGRNIVANGNFHTWQRVEVRQLSPAQFTIPTPTFGNPATYDGTSGIATTTSDLWVGRLFGLYGTFTVTRKAITPEEAEISSGSQFCLNWATTAVTPPAATNTTITNATAPTSSPVTITAAGHGLSNGDYIYIKNNVYSGGVGSLNGTYQVANTTPTTFEITVTPDVGFISYTDFGNTTNDPFFETFAHVYDPSVPVWIRDGTSSFILQYRAPDVRYKNGPYTVRLRMRKNSGTPRIRARLFYDFGSGGSPSATTNTVALLAIPSSNDIVDYIGCVQLPDLNGKTFGSNSNTGYLAVSLEGEATTFNVDVFSVTVRQGVASLPNDQWTQHEALPYLQQFYQGVRIGVVTPVTLGRFYGMGHSFNPPMRGTPDVSFVRNVAISNFNNPTIQNNVTNEGFLASGEANATNNVGYWTSIFEAKYAIPT